MAYVFVVNYEYRVYSVNSDYDYRSRWIDGVSGVFDTFEKARDFVLSEMVKEKADCHLEAARAHEHITYRIRRWTMNTNAREELLTLEIVLRQEEES